MMYHSAVLCRAPSRFVDPPALLSCRSAPVAMWRDNVMDSSSSSSSSGMQSRMNTSSISGDGE